MLEVCVLIVTYGRRRHLLEEVLLSLLRLNICRIVIFDNASDEKIQSLFERNELIGKHRDKIKIFSSDINMGSAGGFKEGLEILSKQNDCDYIWLLDDDNKPHKNALNALLKAHEHLTMQYKDTDFCLLSHRRDRKFQVLMLQGGKTERVFPRQSEFIGVHILDLAKKFTQFVSRRVFTKKVNSGRLYCKDIVELPFAPFGGLFIKRSLLDEVGFPKSDFFLYGDDQEFTYRINQSGVKIFLVALSVIEDIDASWQTKEKGDIQFSRFFKSNKDERLYYFIRNHAYLDSHLFKKSRCLYFMNKRLFLVTCWVVSKFFKDSKKYRLIKAAIDDGENSKLGVNEHIG